MTAQKVTKHSFTLDGDSARFMAQAALCSASKDGVTPVICAGFIQVVGEQLRVTSTDRYRAQTSIAKLKGKSKPHEFLLPLSTLRWIEKNVGFFGRTRSMVVEPEVTITTTHPIEAEKARPVGRGKVTVTIRENESADARTISFTDDLVMGNFPDMAKIFDQARNAPEGTGARIATKWLPMLGVLGGPHRAPVFKFTATDKPDKPGPLLVTFHANDSIAHEVFAEAIIQPNLLLR